MSLVTRTDSPSQLAGAGGLVQTMAASLPVGSTVLAAEDNLLGVLEYARQVEHVRKDVGVIAVGALRYPFYRKQIDIAVPDALRDEWLSQRTWTNDEWAAVMTAWIPTLADEPNLFTQFDKIPGLPLDRLVPAGFLYGIADSTVSVSWSAAGRFWQESPKLYAHDPIAREIMARWQFNFGALAIARGDAGAGWEALVGAVALAPENPELYYLLGDALQRAGRAAEAGTMYSAATELAPYKRKFQDAAARVHQPVAVAQ
jgi:hypothetical protein